MEMLNKLLVINKSDLKKTMFINPKHIGNFLWGKRISNYILIHLKDGCEEIVKLNSNECNLIQDQINKIMNL